MRSKCFVCICCLVTILTVLSSGHAHARKADVRGYRSGKHSRNRILASVENATVSRRKRKTMDCGKYIPPSYMCCGGYLQLKTPGFHFDACCGDRLISTRTTLCCAGGIKPIDWSNACCGHTAYHTDRNFCCFGRLHPRRDFDACCGTHAYKRLKSVCCKGILKRGTRCMK
ncbi:hypothetical protein LSAT2_008689 [Lamellibrachia satsuma]|nr:hypothetical protein LSAT2_008689 [Lamellibrachia satsuma]